MNKIQTIVIILGIVSSVFIHQQAYSQVDREEQKAQLTQLADCELLRVADMLTPTTKAECIVLAQGYKEICDSHPEWKDLIPCKDVNGFNPMKSFLAGIKKDIKENLNDY